MFLEEVKLEIFRYYDVGAFKIRRYFIIYPSVLLIDLITKAFIFNLLLQFRVPKGRV